MFGGICHLFVEECLIKDTCFGGQLFSVELEEGFLCAGIRLPKKRLPISLFSRVFQKSSMIG